MNILLVDDSDAVRMELAEVLRSHNFFVTETSNGLEAMNCLKKANFDFVISDYKMPFIDGFKLAENLMRDFAYQPEQILILTTDTSEKVKHFLKHFDLSWFAKPVQVDCILQELNKYQTQIVA
ncbi:response regulator [Gayadomonas joobiniege]|uniref:response regulator n=1 Tax=Gayadomonas joobiniege TaxID=1234606 RepID=UPI0003827940|nr:response regulator [Gayadomonas joobiniege]